MYFYCILNIHLLFRRLCILFKSFILAGSHLVQFQHLYFGLILQAVVLQQFNFQDLSGIILVFFCTFNFSGTPTRPCCWCLSISGCLPMVEESSRILLPVLVCSNILICGDKEASHTMSLAVIGSLFLVLSTYPDVSGSGRKVSSQRRKKLPRQDYLLQLGLSYWFCPPASVSFGGKISLRASREGDSPVWFFWQESQLISFLVVSCSASVIRGTLIESGVNEPTQAAFICYIGGLEMPGLSRLLPLGGRMQDVLLLYHFSLLRSQDNSPSQHFLELCFDCFLCFAGRSKENGSILFCPNQK